MEKKKLLIIGWDGATFDMIRPLVEQGQMPHIASLMQNGVWGALESTLPPLTPVAWTSISTGVNPGKHGIFDALTYDHEKRKLSFVNANMRKVKPLWSILSERNRTVGVMNVPVTYPPDDVNGFVISGMFTPQGVSDFAYPQGVKDEIEKKFGEYRVECDMADSPSDYLKLILDMVAFREKVALHLMESRTWDFFFVVFIASDRAQHFYWKYLDASHPEHQKYGDAIARVYKRMDQALGKLIEKSGPDTTVMMVSDHGAGPLKSAFFLNNWLHKNEYLFCRKDLAEVMKLKEPSRLRQRLTKSAKAILPNAVLNRIKLGRSITSQQEMNNFFSSIDWEKTIAFSEGVAGGIYINTDVVKPGSYEDVTGRIIKGLSGLKSDSGKRVIQHIYRRGDIYHGEEAKNAPDLIVICSPGFQIIAPNEILFFKKKLEDAMFLSHRWSGRHEQYGIFLLKGTGVKKNIEINNARIIDVAPTALYFMDEAVPEYMDGSILEAAIEDDYFAAHPVRHAGNLMSQEKAGRELTAEQEKDIAERLKGLGYIE